MLRRGFILLMICIDAFKIMETRNFQVTDFLFFIGKVLITGGVVVAAHFLFFNPKDNRLNLNYSSTVPLVVIAIGAYIIASIFFGVYSMAVDTLFLCFRKYKDLLTLLYPLTRCLIKNIKNLN